MYVLMYVLMMLNTDDAHDGVDGVDVFVLLLLHASLLVSM
jgi:hypothetical protein